MTYSKDDSALIKLAQAQRLISEVRVDLFKAAQDSNDFGRILIQLAKSSAYLMRAVQVMGQLSAESDMVWLDEFDKNTKRPVEGDPVE